jgi:hypothetical protein
MEGGCSLHLEYGGAMKAVAGGKGRGQRSGRGEFKRFGTEGRKAPDSQSWPLS